MKARITYGFGYWDCTKYPIGGDFGRVEDKGGLLVDRVERLPRTFHTADSIGYTAEGRKIAFAMTAATVLE